jgi:hypothetical protein
MEDLQMVICPIARAVHCTGCALVKFCPAKRFLGDYGKEEAKTGKGASGKEKQQPECPEKGANERP